MRSTLSVRFRLRPRAFFRLPAPDCGDPLADWNLQTPFRPRIVIEIGNGDLRQSLSDCLLDCAQIVLLVRRYESKCVADLACARGPTHAVDVVIGRLWYIEVDDVTKGLDVD